MRPISFDTHYDVVDTLDFKVNSLREEVYELETLCAERFEEIKDLKYDRDDLIHETKQYKERCEMSECFVSSLIKENEQLKQRLKDYESYKHDQEMFDKLNNITKKHMNELLINSGIQL